MKHRGLISTLYILLAATTLFAFYKLEQILGGSWDSNFSTFFGAVGWKGIALLSVGLVLSSLSILICSVNYSVELRKKAARITFNSVRIGLLLVYLAAVVVLIVRLENPIETLKNSKIINVLVSAIFALILLSLITVEIISLVKTAKKGSKNKITAAKIAKAAENNINKKAAKEEPKKEVKKERPVEVKKDTPVEIKKTEATGTQPPVFKFGKKK